jgi:hypothetical protein
MRIQHIIIYFLVGEVKKYYPYVTWWNFGLRLSVKAIQQTNTKNKYFAWGLGEFVQNPATFKLIL